MTRYIPKLLLFTLTALMVLALLGKTLPASVPQLADAQQMPPAMPTSFIQAQPSLPTSTPTPTTPPTLIPPQRPPTTALPPHTPSPTTRPTRTPAPTPTPNMTTFDTQFKTNPDLQAAICRPDMKLTLHEGQIAVPILLYHFVGRASLENEGQSTTRFNITTHDFDAQLALLHQLGYQTVTISEVTAAISGTYTLPSRPVAITVDDGWIEQYTNILPALQKYGMRATFYIPSTYPVGGRFVTWEQVKALRDAGMEIGSHTRTHVDLTTISAETALYELANSKQVLEEKLGITITSLAYPFGTHGPSVRALTQQAGYRAAVALGPTPKQSAANRYALNRTEIFGTQPLSNFLKWLPWRGMGTDLCPETPMATAIPRNES